MLRSKTGLLAGCAVVLLVLSTLSSPALAATWTCSNTSQLNTAFGGYSSGDTIVITPGTYNIMTGGHTYGLNRGAVTVRSSTGNPNDVNLFGGGINTVGALNEGLQLYSNNIIIRDITVSNFVMHGIHIQPGANDATIDNVHVIDCGEHFIKGGTSTANSITNTVIQNCLLELTQQRNNDGLNGRPNNYIGGIDLLGATNPIVRDNVIKHIEAIDSGDAGIFMWQSISNPTIERNILIGNNKGIALGNPASSNGASGGIVRNNFVVRDSGDSIRAISDEIGMEFCSTSNVKVYNNTVYSVNPSDNNAFRTIHVYAGNTTNLQSKYNVIRGSVFQNAGTWTDTGSIIGTTAQPGWFWDPNNGNLHLSDAATAAIGHALALTDVPQDFDSETRPYGNLYDVGADEYRMQGDANLDLDVDFADYQTLEVNFGKTTGATWAQGDFNYDHAVNFADYQLLEAHFNTVLNPASIPEPISLVLLLLGGLALRRRK